MNINLKKGDENSILDVELIKRFQVQIIWMQSFLCSKQAVKKRELQLPLGWVAYVKNGCIIDDDFEPKIYSNSLVF